MESTPVSSVPSRSLLQFLPCLCACRDFPSLWTVSHKKKWFLFIPKVAFDPGVCPSKGTLSRTQGISGQLVSCEVKKLFWKMEVYWQWSDFPTYSSKAVKNTRQTCLFGDLLFWHKHLGPAAYCADSTISGFDGGSHRNSTRGDLGDLERLVPDVVVRAIFGYSFPEPHFL